MKPKKIFAMLLIVFIIVINSHERYVQAGILDDIADSIEKVGQDGYDLVYKWALKMDDQINSPFVNAVSNVLALNGVFAPQSAVASCVIEIMQDLFGAIPRVEEVNDYLNEHLKIDSDKNITISNEFVNNVVNYIDNYYCDETYMYMSTWKAEDVINGASANCENYDRYMNYVNYLNITKEQFILLSQPTGSKPAFGQLGDTIFDDCTNYWNNPDYYIVYDPSYINQNVHGFHKYDVYNLKWEVVNSYVLRFADLFARPYNAYPYKKYTYLVTLDGRSVKVFRNFEVFKKWTLGDGRQEVYYSNKWINYDNSVDNSITVKGDMITNNDWSKINQEYYDKIDNSVKNYYTENNTVISNDELSELTEKYYQEMIRLMEEILEELNKPSSTPVPTSTPTPTLKPTSTPMPTSTPIPTSVPTPTTAPDGGYHDDSIFDYLEKSPRIFRALADMVTSLFSFVGSLPAMFGTVFFFFPEPIKDMMGVGMVTCIVLGVIRWLRR